MSASSVLASRPKVRESSNSSRMRSPMAVPPGSRVVTTSCPAARSVGRARRRNRDHRHNGADENRFERENQKFFERVRQAYREIARREPRRVVVIEAQRKIEVVHREILAAVEKMLKVPSSVEAKT